jgi:ribose 5-phosphate isomerase B
MKVALASDHAGFALKTGIKDYLAEKGIAHLDYGTYSEESVDYVDFAAKAMEGMLSGECDRAILVCGTGLGMGIVAEWGLWRTNTVECGQPPAVTYTWLR